MNMNLRTTSTMLIALAGTTLPALNGFADNTIDHQITNGQFEVILPTASLSNEFRMAEWTTNLVDWEPVARDFGFAWQNTFPHALAVTTGGANQVLSDPTNGVKRFYRVVSQPTSSLTIRTRFPAFCSRPLSDPREL
jgi:hypothetical protein